jgi:hypothetical protein
MKPTSRKNAGALVAPMTNSTPFRVENHIDAIVPDNVKTGTEQFHGELRGIKEAMGGTRSLYQKLL